MMWGRETRQLWRWRRLCEIRRKDCECVRDDGVKGWRLRDECEVMDDAAKTGNVMKWYCKRWKRWEESEKKRLKSGCCEDENDKESLKRKGRWREGWKCCEGWCCKGWRWEERESKTLKQSGCCKDESDKWEYGVKKDAVKSEGRCWKEGRGSGGLKVTLKKVKNELEVSEWEREVRNDNAKGLGLWDESVEL